MEKSGCVPCAGQSLQEAGRQFGGSGYGGSGYGGSSSGYGLPYGGFGGGYNQAFVECCEGVVNPFILLGIIGGNELDVSVSLRIGCHVYLLRCQLVDYLFFSYASSSTPHPRQ